MMFAIKIIILITLVSYVGFLLFGAIGFIKTKEFVLEQDFINKTNTCIIICARNEENNIEACLNSIYLQNFDKELLEIILVNDASEDSTLSKATNSLSSQNFRFQIINNIQKEGKKNSITKAINATEAELIITRDADTFTDDANWLKTLVSFYEQTQSQFIIAPIEIDGSTASASSGQAGSPSVLTQLQIFENNALAIVTGGFAFYKKAFLCNGANLAFTKNLFEKTNGYKSHEKIISGDDVLFLEEAKKINSQNISYLKTKIASVITYPQKTFTNLLQQKVRWASKFNANPNQTNALLGLIVFLTHFFTLFFLLKAAFTLYLPLFGLFFILSRFLIDFLLLFLASGYFKRPVQWLWFLPLSLLYSVYVLIITILSIIFPDFRQAGKPNWK